MNTLHAAEQDIFRHGCGGNLRQGITVLRGRHHRSTVRSGGLLSLKSTPFKVIFKTAAECSPAEHEAEVPSGDYAGEQSDERLQGTGCQTRRAGERGFAEICWVDQRQGVR